MKEYENEQFKVEENQKFDEYQVFKAEEFKSLELFKAKMEEYKVKEIQKQSFVEGSELPENNTTNKQKDNKVFDKLKNKIMSSSSASASTSATVVTSIGASGAVLCAGVIGAGVVLSPVLDIPLFNQAPIVELINYQVDTVFENDGSISKEITIFFQEDLIDGYECKVTNLKTREEKVLDTSLDYVSFDNLLDEEYNFEVTIYNNLHKPVSTEIVKATMVSSFPYLDDVDYEMLVTYNDDNTFNIYYESLLYYENYDFISNIYVKDELDNLINPSNVIDNLVCFEDLSEGRYNFVSNSYVIENSNNYLINSKEIKSNNLETLDYQTILSEEQIKININELVYDDVDITLTYLDDNTTETYTYTKEEALNEIAIYLTKPTEKVKVNINTNTTFNNKVRDINNINYKGKVYKNKIAEEVLETNIQTNINLSNIEILNDASYMFGYVGNATLLVFDGYLKGDSYYDVNIYNSQNELIASEKNILKANNRVGFTDLPTDETVTIEYITYDSLGNEISRNNYETTLVTPVEYFDAAYSIGYNHTNSGNVYTTYNDDKTANYYFITNVNNTSSYDAFIRIGLTSSSESGNSYYKYTNGHIASIEDVPYDETYSLSYCKVIKDGIKSHIVDSPLVVSGSVNEIINYEKIPVYYSETEELRVYDIRFDRAIQEDFIINVFFDNEEEYQTTIKASDVVDGRFILDLSAFEFGSAHCEFTCIADMSNFINDDEDLFNIKGSKFLERNFALEITFEYGSVIYSSHKVDSNAVSDPNSGEQIIYKDIYIYIDNYMLAPFSCKVVSKYDNSSKILDEESGFVVFNDLLSGTYEFELQIIDKNEKVYSSEIISINTESSMTYSTSQLHDSLITYLEEDSSYNFYYYPIHDYENNEISTEYKLLDQNGNELETKIVENGGVAIFENINSDAIQLIAESTLIVDGNQYVIADYETELIELNIVPFITNRISENEITLETIGQLDSDINVTITYKDYGTSESLVYEKDTWTGSVTIPLSQLSSDVELTVSANLVIMNNNSGGNIINYLGSLSKNYTYSETLSYNIT